MIIFFFFNNKKICDDFTGTFCFFLYIGAFKPGNQFSAFGSAPTFGGSPTFGASPTKLFGQNTPTMGT